MSNYWSGTAPFGDWFDDATWSNNVLPRLANLAGAAKLLGFAGVAFDSELYAGAGAAGSWNWNYPGNTHSEAAVRSQARQRGAQLMSALVGAYPDVDIIAIHMVLPEGWSELVQQEINGISNAYQDDGEDRLLGRHDERLRLRPHPPDGPRVQQDLAPVPGDMGHGVHLRPQSDVGDVQPTPLELGLRVAPHRLGSVRLDRLGPGLVRRGPLPRRWRPSSPRSASGAPAVRSPTSRTRAELASTTGPYIPGMQAAAAPGTVDTHPPTGTVTHTTRSGAIVNVSGSATDNFAVRDVRWSTPTGATGRRP